MANGLIIQSQPGDTIISTSFNGVNEYISMGDTLGFERTNPFSISMWVYPNDITTSQGLVTKQIQGSIFRGYQLNIISNGKLYFALINTVSTNSAVVTTLNGALSLSNWQHIVLTYNGSSNTTGINFYVNGVLKTKDTPSFNNLSGTIINSVDFQISARNGGNIPFNGKIDKPIIYNTELTAGQVTTAYNFGRKTGIIPGLPTPVSQWELDTLNPVDVVGTNNGTSFFMDSNNLIVESSGEPEDIPNNNGLVVSSQVSNTIISTSFNGVNEYISVPHNASLSFERTDSFSINFNFYSNDNTSFNIIIAKMLDSSPYKGYAISKTESNKIRLSLSNTAMLNDLVVDTVDTIPFQQWIMITVTYNGTSVAGGVNIFFNTVNKTITPIRSNLTASISNISPLWIGARYVSNTTNGYIDKVIIYNDVITSGEVTTIYNYGRKAGLIGIGGEVSQWELDATNPVDVVGSNNGTSFFMDASNIIVESAGQGDIQNNNGIIISEQ